MLYLLMSELLSFILVCFGCTNILAYGKIFDAVRPKHKFFHCPMCLGFWVGALFSLVLKSPFVLNEISGVSNIMIDGFNMFLCGCLSSGTSYMLAMIVGDGGIQHEHKSTKILGKGL